MMREQRIARIARDQHALIARAQDIIATSLEPGQEQGRALAAGSIACSTNGARTADFV